MKALVLSALALTIAAPFATPFAVQAKPYYAHPNASINQRQTHQDHRLAQGVRSGSLTRAEAVRLEQSQNRINATEARMRADGGGLSQVERARLQVALTQQSRNIYAQKHDRQVRAPFTQTVRR